MALSEALATKPTETRRKVCLKEQPDSRWIAFYEDNPGKWEIAKTDVEALGQLFISCLDEFNSYIYWYDKQGNLV